MHETDPDRHADDLAPALSVAEKIEQYDSMARTLTLAVLAVVVGIGTGLIGAYFRLGLLYAERFRGTALIWAHDRPILGLAVILLACAAASSLAAFLVRQFSPQASGSGIPHVEAVLRRSVLPAPYALLPVKFFGGLLAIGSGLALGREGPSVQMGASIAVFTGRAFRLAWADSRILIAAGAGAGLATAFNAPIAGAVFVFEELVDRFEGRIALAALGASAAAIAVARMILGDTIDFQVAALEPVQAQAMPLYLVFGCLTGLIAVLYNNTLLGAIAIAERCSVISVEIRAAIVGAVVGLVAWFAPSVVGGGDGLTQGALLGTQSLMIVPLIFITRFVLGAISYAAATPGGLFAPMLVLGAQAGLMFGGGWREAFPDSPVQPVAFALVGMASFFAGVVRAPVTGMVLVTEMTGNAALLLPMLLACFGAMLVPALLRNTPIYESLGRLASR